MEQEGDKTAYRARPEIGRSREKIYRSNLMISGIL